MPIVTRNKKYPGKKTPKRIAKKKPVKKKTVKKKPVTEKENKFNTLLRDKVKGRALVYPALSAKLCIGEDAITMDEAKELLGWQEEPDGKSFGRDYLLKHNEKKIRCLNNLGNRPYSPGLAARYRQEHLRRHWQVNGETIIIGVTGLVLSGQHTLISFIQAVDEWNSHPVDYPRWQSEPVLERILAIGIREEDRVVNTIDSGKPRSLSDVVYRAHHFDHLTKQGQNKASRMTDHAIKMLWQRTGTHSDAFAVRRTHSEAVSFLEYHKKLLEAVSYIYEEDEGKLSKYITPGYASAALYLMAASATKTDAYFDADQPSEKFIDFSLWDDACEFFVKLASGDQQLTAVRNAIGKLAEQGNTGIMGRWTVLVKAWNVYSESKGKKINVEDVYPEMEMKDDILVLVEHPLLGGIDLGDEGLEHKGKNDPDPKAIEDKADKEREKRYPKGKEASRAGDKWNEGDRAWVHADGEDAYFGTLTNVPYSCIGGDTRVLVDAEDGNWEVNVEELSMSQFELTN